MPTSENIQEVSVNDDFNAGRDKWNANDVELAKRLDTAILFAGAMFYENVKPENAVPTDIGHEFTLDSLEEGLNILNGSVMVVINGIYYLSNTDQADSEGPTDFHITNDSIIVHNTNNGGTINIKLDDSIGIYFQKE